MRKLFWGMAAVAVAASAGMFWLKWQGPVSPFSFAATAAIRCCQPTPNGFEGTSGGSLTRANPAVADNGEDDLTMFRKPAEPVLIAEIELPVSEPGMAAAIDFTPMPIIPAITIREPLEVARPVAIAESGDLTADLTVIPAGLRTDAGLENAPAAIPAVAPALPFWDNLLPVPNLDRPTDDDPDDDDLLSIWSLFFPSWAKPAAGQAPDAPAPSDCREDEHYYDQYPGCPYIGPYPGQRYYPPLPYVEPIEKAPPTVAPGNEATPQNNKANQTMLRQRLRTLHQMEEGWLFPEVDTMEFRQSDHSPYDHLPDAI